MFERKCKKELKAIPMFLQTSRISIRILKQRVRLKILQCEVGVKIVYIF